MSIVGATQLSKIDVDAFSQMKELKNLMITNTNISDVDFLHGTHKVTVSFLKYTEINFPCFIKILKY